MRTRLQKREDEWLRLVDEDLNLIYPGTDFSIPEICQLLHSSLTGISDAYDPVAYVSDVAYLQACLLTWEESVGIGKEYDAAVKSMIEAVLAEVEYRATERRAA